MSLTHHKVFPFPTPSPRTLPSNPRPFDDALIRRLSAIAASLSADGATVRLSSLTLAVDLLSATLASFSALLSDPSLARSEADSAALSAHLDDASAALLDSANSLSSLVDRLSRLRLHLAFGLHLLSARPLHPDPARRARAYVSEWRDNLASAVGCPDLAPGNAPPRGRATAVQRAIYAVEAVSALVVALVASSLGARPDLTRIRVSADFSWSAAFNGVLAAVKGGGKPGGFAAEIEAVDSTVKKLTAVLDRDGGVTEDEIHSVASDAAKKTEEMTEGLDHLGNAINALFRAGLCARNTALQGFRIGPNKCK